MTASIVSLTEYFGSQGESGPPWDDAAECRSDAIAPVVGDDEQHVAAWSSLLAARNVAGQHPRQEQPSRPERGRPRKTRRRLFNRCLSVPSRALWRPLLVSSFGPPRTAATV